MGEGSRKGDEEVWGRSSFVTAYHHHTLSLGRQSWVNYNHQGRRGEGPANKPLR